MDDDPTKTEPFMRDLREVGLLQKIQPDHDTKLGLDHASFQRGFLTLIEGLQPSPTAGRTRLHSGKMAWSLFRQLQDRGLAEPADRGLWWSVETRTAGFYMAYLAAAVSAARPGTMPVTDESVSIATLGNPHLDFKERLAAPGYSIILEALPAPSAAVSPRELAAFKEQHAEALTRCRRFLDKLADLVAITATSSRRVLQRSHRRSLMTWRD